MLAEYYLQRFVLCVGPSMEPTLDAKDNILLVDCFTTNFVRKPQRNEIVLSHNPFKPHDNLVKRVLYLEGEYAEFFDVRTQDTVKVLIPPNHVWVEGDNKHNSRDSRDFGPLSLELVHGIVRGRTSADQSMEETKTTFSTNMSIDDAQDAHSPLYLYIEDLIKKIQTNIDSKYEPVDQLRELNHLLNTQHLQIHQELTEDQTGKLKRDFYKLVFKTTAEKMLGEKVLSQAGYLPQILRFFRNILVNFFPLDIEEESLAEIVHSLFNLDASLYTTALQQTYRKQFQDQQSEDDETLEQKRIRQETEWRNSLAIGSRIDCIMTITEAQIKISHWAQGTVVSQLDPDQFYVAFDNENSLMNKLVNRFGPEIAYPGTFTDDYDWRYNLQDNDIVDALDSEAVWYRSTILRLKSLNIANPLSSQDEEAGPQKRVEAYVAYRVYEEEGSKNDDDGSKYTGWSNKYDIWISATSPQIQRAGKMIKYYKNAGKASMIYDNVVDDLSDVLENTKERKVWAVFRNNFFSNLKCIPDYFNEFGMRGGFNKILHFMGRIDDSKPKTLKHIYFLMDFLSKSMPLWHRQFACEYIPQLKEEFERGLLYTNQQNTGPTQIKFNKESLAGLQRAYQNILRRYYTQDKYNIIVAELNFSIGFSLLKSEKLEQRIQGIKEIIEQIKGTRFSSRKTLNASDVMRKLKKENIFESIFGDNYHIQLIQRSQEIIKFYINEREITEKEIDYMWQTTLKDQQTKMEIYKIISEIAIMFKNEEIELLVDRFARVPPEQFVEKEIECVYELSKYSYRQYSFTVRAVQLFWDIAVQERPYKKQIIELAIDKLIELIRNWERDQKSEYLMKAVQKIQENKSTVQCIKIIQKILEAIPQYRVNNQPTLQEISNQLLKDFDLINLVIFDLAQYEEIINESWAKGTLNDKNVELTEVLDLPFTHRSQCYSRLNFIRQMLQNSVMQLEQEQLDQIWDIMIVRSKISIDSEIFFNWLKQLLGDNNKLSVQLINHFFQTKVCSQDANFKYLKKAGFDCICNIFLQINEQHDKINILSLPSYNASNNNNNNQKLDFKIHVPPNELEGIELIWKLLQECDKKNIDLTASVIDLVTKIYHNLSQGLEEMKHEIEDEFCRESLNRLARFINDQQASDEEKKQFTHIITISLKSFFQDSEKNGFGRMKTHSALDRGDFLQRVVIQNNITSQKDTPRFIELNVYQNMTLWGLKILVAEKTKQSPLRIQLLRQDQKRKALNDQDHALTLKDLRITDYEIIYAQKKPIIFQQRVPLINKKKELVPEVRAIFEDIFDKFSNQDGFMTPDTCVEFIRSSTQDQTVCRTDSRIVRLFNEYDRDTDGLLTKEEFLEFYRDRSIQKADLVWSNLNSHGYGNDLKPLNSQYLQDDPNELKDASLLPRYKLSHNLNTFDEIFSLFEKCPEKAQDDLWILLINLRTNSLYYSKLLTLSDPEELVQSTSIYKLLYNLQILESLINDYQAKQKQEVKCYYYESQDYSNNFPSIDQQNQKPPQDFQVDNEDVREVQSAAPQSGYAIPLPPALPSQNMNNDADGVPIVSGVPGAIGPSPPPGHGQNNQNGNNNNSPQQKVSEMLDNFKGHVITTEIQEELFSDNELKSIIGVEDITSLKGNWIKNFISIGAFKILLQFLTNLNNRCANKPQKEVINSKVERETLFQILKIMKTLLLCSFLANSNSPELSLELTRKMSSSKDAAINKHLHKLIDEIYVNDDDFDDNNDNSKSNNTNAAQNLNSKNETEKRKLIQIEQEDTDKLYEPLIAILQGELGNQILGSVDFKAFQDQIMSIIQLILGKKDKIVSDDRTIIESALSLWISLIVYNSDLLQSIYDNQSQREQDNQPSMFENLIEEGLLCQNFSIRGCFKENFKFIFSHVRSQTLSEQPNIFFLRVMLKNIDRTNCKSRDSKQFFETLKLLMELYFDAEKNKALSYVKIFDNQELLKDFIQRLRDYESREKKGQFFEDTNLVGYLVIIQEIIQNEPQALTFEEYKSLLNELVEKDLFTFDIDPIDSHITKEVDIQAYEKQFTNKCITQDSRVAAYNLIYSICQIQPELVSEIINSYWYPLVFKVKKPKKSGFNPKGEGRSYYGYCGIKNLGCICYMNAMIQQFFHIPAFRYSLLSAEDNVPPRWQDFEGDQVDDNMLHQLRKLFGFLELSERQDYNPREFCFSFKDFAGQPTNVRIQQDSQEFLNLAFDRLENLLANSSQKYLLQNIFGGKTCSMMICKSCGNLRQRYEDFYNISLEVKNQKSIYDGLRKFVLGEIINDFQCEACNQRVDVERKTVLNKLPNMLIIHLQRIVFDFDSLMNQKLNSRVEFPNILNLKPFMMNEVLKQEKDILKKTRKEQRKKEKDQQKQDQKQEQDNMDLEEGKDEDVQNQEAKINNMEESPQKNDAQDISSDDDNEAMEDVVEEEPEENFQYKLVGVILHMGTADAGHYISYINTSRGVKSEETPEWLQTDKDKWLEFNDSNVKNYMFSNLEEDCFGGIGQNSNGAVNQQEIRDYSKNAYMLIYEKRRKEKMKIVISDEHKSQSSNALGCDGTAIARGQNNDYLLNVFPQLQETLVQNQEILFDEEKKENYALVEFNSAQKFVPNSTYKVSLFSITLKQMVHEDNLLFLLERQIFNHNFYETTKKLIELLQEKSPEALQHRDNSDNLYQFMDRLIFELVSLSQDNKQLLDLTKLYLNMLAQNPEQTFKLIDNRILVEKEKLGKDQRGFFEALIASMDKDTRDLNQLILTFVVNKLIEWGEDERLETVMSQVLALIPDDLSKNWLKIGQYLSFIFEVTRSGYKQLCYMINKKIISKLIDFYLENESPLVVSGQSKKRSLMGSSYANPPLESLILTISYIVRNYSFVRMNPNEYPEGQHFAQIQNQPSVYLMPIYNEELPPLSEEDISMLNQKAFYTKNLKSAYEREEFGRLTAHLSFGNYEFSRRICKRILIGINKASADEIEPYLHALVTNLTLQDQYIDQRIEWLLGIPHLKIERNHQSNYQNENKTYVNMGAALIDTVNDDVIDYKSTLFESSETVKESILQLLYHYRKRWAKYTLSCLVALLQSAAQDRSQKIANYLKTLDPPNYIYGRYIDWIKPYIKDAIENSLRFQNNNTSKQELMMGVSALQLLENLLNPQQQQQNQQPENKEPSQEPQPENKVFTYDSRDGGPEQYIIWRYEDEREVEVRQFQEQELTIRVVEMQVRVSESKPNGITNLQFPSNMFSVSNSRGYNQPEQDYRQDVSNGSWNTARKPQYGRGQQFRITSHNNNYQVWKADNAGQSRTIINNMNIGKISYKGGRSYGNKQKKKKIIVQSQPKPDREDNTQEGGQFGGVPTAQDVHHREKDDEERMDNQYEDQDDDSMDVEYNNDNQNIGSNEQSPQKDSEQFVMENFSQEETDFNPQSDQQENQHIPPQEAQAAVPQINQEQDQDLQQENINQDSWEISSFAVLVFQVINHSQNSPAVKINLRFNDSGVAPLNFRLPKSTIPCKVQSQREKEICVFTKLRPFDDWGFYSFDVEFDHQQQSQMQDKKVNFNFEQLQDQNNQGVGTQDDWPTGGYDDINAEKECPTCTFLNSSLLTFCEICGGKLA